MNFNVSTPANVVAPTAGRILAPDLARGMMLLFIAVANVSAYLWGRNTFGLTSHPNDEGALGTALSALVIVLIDGHVYPMFAFLFGYGITQFAYSRIARGLPGHAVSRMLLRRHLWLLAFGAVHALLLFAGDILGAYALTGLVLSAALLRGGNRLIKTLLWVFGSLCAGLMLLSILALIGIGLLLPPELTQSITELTGAESSVSGVTDLMSGLSNYWLAMAARLGLWATSSVAVVLSIVVPFMVLLGGFAARHRWLEGVTARFGLGAVAGWGIVLGVLGSLPTALEYLGVWQPNMLLSTAMLLLSQLCGLAGGLGYAALFGVVGTRIGAAVGPVPRAIAAVGKRSLSFYLLQSLVFAPLLAAWGFGLGASISSATAYLIALLVWLASLGIAVGLERGGRRGPAETLLRTLTYGRYDTAQAARSLEGR